MSIQVNLPTIIQGGMGVNISCPFLARKVSMRGQQGTVSGVALERVMAYILQHGDPDGHIRRALATFPFQNAVRMVMENYFTATGPPAGQRFKNAPMFTVNPSAMLISLVICANYAFVWLAKEGHQNQISINYLEKIAMPHVFAIYGAMLAGVEVITMGAGIAMGIPSVTDNYAQGRAATYGVPVLGKTVKEHVMSFDPATFFDSKLPDLKRPRFLPIVSSNVLAMAFTKRLPEGSVDGFVVEEPSAGGHNAPPRKVQLDAKGLPLPIYGPKDAVDYAGIAKLGLPFWIGGSCAHPEKLRAAQELGAQGVQVGTAFALCEDSGMNQKLRSQARRLGYRGELGIRTDMRVSPTGFPFKVAELPGTLSDSDVYRGRSRVCNQGVLLSLAENGDGKICYRCPSEPVEIYERNRGRAEDTFARGCICNGLLTTADANWQSEPAIVTLGDDVSFLRHLMRDEKDSYDADAVLSYILGSTQKPT